MFTGKTALITGVAGAFGNAVSGRFPETESDGIIPRDKLRSFFSQYDSVIAAYLFGSAASGRRRPSSDVDLAILLDEGKMAGFHILSVITDAERLLNKRIDLIILNHAGELLKRQVRKHGQLLFERDRLRRKSFEISGRKRYEDFLYYHRKYADVVLYKGIGHG